jgi:methylmalonyl-CoA decarboxylase
VIERYTYPVIAMINGDTYGGAMEIIAACDVRIGVEGARFGITPAKIGLVYGGQAINRIMNIIGPAKTKEMLFTANAIHADLAAEIGLLNYVVERQELEDRTYDIAEDIAGNAPLSLRAMKEIIDALLDKRRLSEVEVKWIQQLRDEAFASEDHQEGVQAFDEERQPEFRDR